MNRFFRSDDAAEQFGRAVCDDFIQVHVGLRSAAGHPDFEREIAVESAVEYFVRRLADCVADCRVQSFCFFICDGGGFFYNCQRMNDFLRDVINPDIEVGVGALGLRPPVFVGGDLDLPHAVAFRAVCGVFHCLILSSSGKILSKGQECKSGEGNRA